MTLLANNPKFQAFDSNGNPLVGGKLYTYAAGTTTEKATYADALLTSPNTNPIILDARGEALIYLGAGSYKLVLKDTADSTIWTVDSIDGGAVGFSYYPYATDMGSANAYAITVSNGPGGYSAGQVFLFNPSADSTGASTLNVNGLGAKAITMFDGAVLSNGAIQTGMPALVTYDGSVFKLLNAFIVRADSAGTIQFGMPETMRLTSDGRLVLGASTALSTAHIEKAQASETAVFVHNPNASGSAALRLGPSDRSTNADYTLSVSPAGAVTDAGNRKLSFTTNAVERLAVDATGTIRTGNSAVATGYEAAGDMTLPATGKIRALNTAAFFVNFNGTGTIAIRNSFNVTSITDNGAGDYTLNLTNALPSTNSTVLATGCLNATATNTADFVTARIASTTTIRVFVTAVGGGKLDWEFINVAGFGG